MLPQVNRVKKKKDFEALFKNSRSFKNNLFIFKIAKNSLEINRFGFVVSQKVSKRATVRNKVRRRLASAVRAEAKNTKAGADVVIIALSGIEKKEFSEVKEAVKNTLIKSGLIDK